MTPTEHPREKLARAFGLVLEALDAYAAMAQACPARNAEEIMTGAQAAAEAGVTSTAVAKWCTRRLITGAKQRRRRGHWRFTRGAWEAFRGAHRIRRPRKVTLA